MTLDRRQLLRKEMLLEKRVLDKIRSNKRNVGQINESSNKRNEAEFSALKTLRVRDDIVIKPADKGGALVVWRADLYRNEAQRQLSDSAFYRQVEGDLTSTHQTTIRKTVINLISSGELPDSHKSLFIHKSLLKKYTQQQTCEFTDQI